MAIFEGYLGNYQCTPDHHTVLWCLCGQRKRCFVLQDFTDANVSEPNTKLDTSAKNPKPRLGWT